MVSYYYPPVGGTASRRITKLAKYLPEFGWSPTVLTVTRDSSYWLRGDASEGELPGVKVIRAPFPDLVNWGLYILAKCFILRSHRPRVEYFSVDMETDANGLQDRIVRWLKRWANRWASFPDRYFLWFPFALARGLLELRSVPYEAILSSYPPWTNHLVAGILHRLTGLPWVADFRDPWTQCPLWERSKLQLWIEKKIEKRLVAGASAIVTVTEPILDMLKEFHGEKPGGFVCITNGYDPGDFIGLTGGELERFTMTYTGSLSGRDPTALAEVVEELIAEGIIGPDDIRIRFYGLVNTALEKLCQSLEHPEIIEIKGMVSNRESLARQKESTALLVFVGDHPYSAKVLTGKVFEYMGSKRPVLAWAPCGGTLVDLLDRTGAGFAATDRGELKDTLRQWIDEFQRTGRLSYGGVDVEIERHSWKQLGRRYANILNGMADPGATKDG